MVASNYYAAWSDDDSTGRYPAKLVGNVQVAFELLQQVREGMDKLTSQHSQDSSKDNSEHYQDLKQDLKTWWETQSSGTISENYKDYEVELLQFLEQSESELYTVLDKVANDEYTFQQAQRDQEASYRRSKQQLEQLEQDIVEEYASMRGMLTSLLPPERSSKH
jgi:predicted  nucleic acid-binding Zn-ribbon protein